MTSEICNSGLNELFWRRKRMPPYHILSMDGGGIRGLITAILLERLEQARPGFRDDRFICWYFNRRFISAWFSFREDTNSGSWIVWGLRQGGIQGYVYWWNKGHWKPYRSRLWSDAIKEVLKIQFGDLTLGELQKRVLVSSFHLDPKPRNPDELRVWKAKFFHNYPGTDLDAGQKVVDVAIFTSAAPSYFPIYNGYIDGGVVAGNPSVCALAQALNPLTGGQKIGSIALLSISTGLNPWLFGDEEWGLGIGSMGAAPGHFDVRRECRIGWLSMQAVIRQELFPNKSDPPRADWNGSSWSNPPFAPNCKPGWFGDSYSMDR